MPVGTFFAPKFIFHWERELKHKADQKINAVINHDSGPIVTSIVFAACLMQIILETGFIVGIQRNLHAEPNSLMFCSQCQMGKRKIF